MMITRYLKIFLFILSFCSFIFPQLFPVSAQPLHQGEWKTYTAMDSINDLALVTSTGNVWAATWGGAFRFNPLTPKTGVVTLRNSDGLSDNNLTAVAADPSGKIYFGGQNGTLDIYDESLGAISSIRDIALATQYVNRKIYQISLFGSRLYLSTGFGLSIYDTTQKAFTETITHFGSLREQDTVFASTEFGDSVLVVLSGALAIAAKNAPNLSDPFAWHIVAAPVATTLNSIISVNGKIVIGGPIGIYTLDADTLTFIPLTDSISVVKLAASGNTLYILDSRNKQIITSTDIQNFSPAVLPGDNSVANISAFVPGNFGAKVFGYGIGGAVVQPSSGSLITKIYPEGPLSNDIQDLHFAGSLGKLFVCLNQIGLSIFEPGNTIWTGLSTGDRVLPRVSYTSSFYDSIRSKLWLASFGSGLYSLDSASPSHIKHYDSVQGITSLNGRNQGFTIIGRGALDNDGNFITTSWASNGEGLLKTSDGNTFTPIQLNPSVSPPYHPYNVTVQDMDGIYYVGMHDIANPTPIGVCTVAPDGSTQTVLGGAGQTLGSAVVSALLVDQDNGLWCGTNVGVQVLTHSFGSAGKPVFHSPPRSLGFTDQQIVHAIVVDGVGNKWVGTDNGVFILSADGSDSLAHFTTANSPLIDNSILSIAIDIKNGEAYLGTHKGISRVGSIYQLGKTDYSSMYIYPNPVIQHSDDAMRITISGLAGGSTVKIFTVGGRLVATIDGTQLGSTVTWNGRDENGKLLASGVYIAAAASPVTSKYGETKFVLIRK